MQHWLEREMAQWVHHEGSIRRIITSERSYNRATSCSPQKMYTLKTHSGRNHYQDRNPVPSCFVTDDLTTVLPRSIVFISVPIINLMFKHAVLDTSTTIWDVCLRQGVCY